MTNTHIYLSQANRQRGRNRRAGGEGQGGETPMMFTPHPPYPHSAKTRGRDINTVGTSLPPPKRYNVEKWGWDRRRKKGKMRTSEGENKKEEGHFNTVIATATVTLSALMS
uniref:Uncharacterized protein n=1 Tax=Palpitomonas bilix TaxID=652834 RepID=A0A7S3D135_9EUKA